MVFDRVVGALDHRDNIFSLAFSRPFVPIDGPSWAKGQTKQMVIGAVFNKKGAPVITHSRKHEVRLGNEIWMAANKRKLLANDSGLYL